MKKDANIATSLPQTIKDRLKLIGLEVQNQYFTIDQATREKTVTRTAISYKYGGNPRTTFPNPPREKFAVHGMNDFMFMVATDRQPEAPQIPGAPGLWLSTEINTVFNQIKRVFVKVRPAKNPKAKTSRYQYMGMYELKTAAMPYLTREEYAAQSHLVSALCSKKSFWFFETIHVLMSTLLSLVSSNVGHRDY